MEALSFLAYGDGAIRRRREHTGVREDSKYFPRSIKRDTRPGYVRMGL